MILLCDKLRSGSGINCKRGTIYRLDLQGHVVHLERVFVFLKLCGNLTVTTELQSSHLYHELLIAQRERDSVVAISALLPNKSVGAGDIFSQLIALSGLT
jgi:hypothetical protein